MASGAAASRRAMGVWVRRLSSTTAGGLRHAAVVPRVYGEGEQGDGQDGRRSFFFPVAAIAAIGGTLQQCAGSAPAEGPEGSGDGGSRPPPRRLYYVKEMKRELEQRLADFRHKRFQGWSAGPRSSKEPAYPLIMVARELGGPYLLEVPLPQFCHYGKVIAASVGALAREGRVQVHTIQNDSEATLLSFVMLDKGTLDGKGGSLLLSCPRADSAKLILYRDDGFTDVDVDAVVESYVAAWSSTATGALGLPDLLDSLTRSQGPGRGMAPRSESGAGSSSRGLQTDRAQAGLSQHEDVAAKLRKLGAEMYDKHSVAVERLSWEALAGYDEVKSQVEDTVIQALKHPDTYEKIARSTRHRFESNRPRAVLFEGPPGTGKTLTARIIASLTEVPLVYVPVERIMTKWYGESENKLSQIFETCNQMGGALIFIDEVDALATSRDTGNMHEATRRILSVILQNIEGFKQGSKNVLVCATNRKQDLDAALISRFDTCIRFDLPSARTRAEVFRRYAKHLSDQNLAALADRTTGLSCRDIKEVCENAERRWASKLIRGEEPEDALLPPLTEYLRAAHARIKMGHGGSAGADAAVAPPHPGGRDSHSV